MVSPKSCPTPLYKSYEVEPSLVYLPVGILPQRACSEPDAYPKLLFQNLYLPKIQQDMAYLPTQQFINCTAWYGSVF